MTYQWLNGETETPIVELRRYTLHPGQRETLIDLFEREFVAPQEALGARVLGTFRVENAPDSFVWLRGFADMERRRQALEGFYGGPAWARHRDAANATMVDSDDVHLVRAITPQGGLKLTDLMRYPGHAYTLLVSELRFPELVGNYHLWLRQFLRKAGADPIASFATLPAENNFPRLPVWQNRTVHVALLRGAAPVPELPRELRDALRGDPEIIRLTPTAKSLLR
jgi:hypothetical protein